MSRKSGLKRRQIENIAQKVMPVLIYNLLQAGKLDRSRLSDRQYVWSVALGSDDEDIEKGRTIIDKRFIEYAEKAIAAQDLEVAVVLIATVIEHRLNRFYVQALEMSLSDSTISEILRNSIHAKLEWLMSLVSPRPIPEDLRKRVKHLTDLRNAVVHYKFAPFDLADPVTERDYAPFREQLASLDADSMITIPDELQQELETILEDIDPDYKLAKELAEQVLHISRQSTTAASRIGECE